MLQVSIGKGVKFLKILREEKGWSMYRAAQELGVNKQTYAYYEKEANGLKLPQLLKIQAVYKLSDKKLMTLIRDEYDGNLSPKKPADSAISLQPANKGRNTSHKRQD